MFRAPSAFTVTWAPFDESARFPFPSKRMQPAAGLGRPALLAIFAIRSSLANLSARFNPLSRLGTAVLLANDRVGSVPIHCHWYQPFVTGVREKERSLLRRAM